MNDLDKTKAQLMDELAVLRQRVQALEQPPIPMTEKQHSNVLLHSVIENLPLMVFVKDAKTLNFELFNKAGEQLLGYSRDDLIGKSDYDFFPQQEAEFFIDKDRKVLNGRKLIDIPEESIHTANGERFLHTKKIPIFDDKGEPRYLLGISMDITEQKYSQQALYRAKKEAEMANQAKSDFLASMSHELRTPLNAILGFAQLLQINQKAPLNEVQHNSVTHIIEGGNHLLKLINDVLDLASIEAGKAQLEIVDIPIKGVVEESFDFVRTIASQMNITLVGDCDNANHIVRGDLTRTTQILLNFLSNAIKYNKPDGVVSISFDITGSNNLRINVTDTGNGIAKVKQLDLFKPFNRLGAEQSNIEGSGIGLVVCKNLLQQMEGKIGFESEVGKGSTFWFELPLAAQQLKKPSAQLATDEETTSQVLAATMLYIEDNLSNILLMEAICHSIEGVDLIISRSAEHGIVTAKAKQPDIIIMDIDLPGMSGIEAAKHLRFTPQTAHIPIVGLSAKAMPNDIQSALNAGFHQYLSKPVNVELLVKTLRELLD